MDFLDEEFSGLVDGHQLNPRFFVCFVVIDENVLMIVDEITVIGPVESYVIPIVIEETKSGHDGSVWIIGLSA